MPRKHPEFWPEESDLEDELFDLLSWNLPGWKRKARRIFWTRKRSKR